MIVFTHPRWDTSHSDIIIDHALTRQLAVLYATTDNRLEFFFEPAKNAESTITHDQGCHSDGTRHPHSWSIVDERELIDWFMELFK